MSGHSFPLTPTGSTALSAAQIPFSEFPSVIFSLYRVPGILSLYRVPGIFSLYRVPGIFSLIVSQLSDQADPLQVGGSGNRGIRDEI